MKLSRVSLGSKSGVYGTLVRENTPVISGGYPRWDPGLTGEPTHCTDLRSVPEQ